MIESDEVTYWYEGQCPQTGDRVRLPRTKTVEAIAHQLMQEIEPSEGKMYGVLLVETIDGKRQILKAFSGLLNGESTIEGWIPPIEGRNSVRFEESQTVIQLETLKRKIIDLHSIPERQQHDELNREFEQKLNQLAQQHRDRKHHRQQQRQLNLSDTLLKDLEEQSKRDGIERRNLKRDRDAILQPLKQTIDTADNQIHQLKQQRRQLSQQLQLQMHQSYRITNFGGETRSLTELLPAMPTGTGECCAPKLLHYAATHRLKPLAMAEFWCGESVGDRIHGEFYGACAERCQPIMGFMLSGLVESIAIAYQDEWLIAVDKPAGLLAVPGRYGQACLLNHFSDAIPVHRLDQDTSGLMILARDIETYKYLSQQFQQRQIEKIYEAVLIGTVIDQQGIIDLPLSSDLSDRPKQKIDYQNGKQSITRFQVLETESSTTRIEFRPLTGRTHQIRVHAAQGLGCPILGDRLYSNSIERLHLHAREIKFLHPHTGETIHLKLETPF